jgi:hypothetical protein
MTTNSHPYQTILEQIGCETIASAAPVVDRDGAFPEESIEALKASGLLGAMSGPEVGGLGLGVPGAAAAGRPLARDAAHSGHGRGTAKEVEAIGFQRTRGDQTRSTYEH